MTAPNGEFGFGCSPTEHLVAPPPEWRVDRDPALLAERRQIRRMPIDEIEDLCRCGTYLRVRQAIKSAAAKMA